MDLIVYSFKQEEISEITKKLQNFQNSLFLDMVVLSDDGGRLIAYAPYVEQNKTFAQRIAVISAGVSGAVDQLEVILSSKKSMFFNGMDKNMYVQLVPPRFLLVSVFSHKVPLGSVKLMKEKLAKDLENLLRRALERKETKIVRFEDLAI